MLLFSNKMSNSFLSLTYVAAFIWNHLHNTVRSAPTYLPFRKNLKTYFFKKAFPSYTVFPVIILLTWSLLRSV